MGSHLEVISFKDVVTEHLFEPLSFVLSKGDSVALITSSQEQSDDLTALLVGLSIPVQGEIILLGEDLTIISERSLNVLRQKIAVVYPSGGLISNLKVWENLVLPLEYHAVCSKEEIKNKALAALKRVSYVGGIMDAPGHLSLYNKKLLGLARAMIVEPLIIAYNALFDAVYGEEKDRIISSVIKFHKENGSRVSIFITSDPETIKELPINKWIYLKGGECQ